MTINMNTGNMTILQGRISRIGEYSPGKAANVTVAVENGKAPDGSDRKPTYVQTKNFTPACYNNLKKGMLVRIYGHISPSSYMRDGERVYNQDVIADFIEFLESKATVQTRAMNAVNT